MSRLYLGLEEIIFVTEVFTDICLMVCKDTSWLHASASHSRLGRYSESLMKVRSHMQSGVLYKRNIAGRVDDDSLVLRNVLGHLGDMSLQDVMAVQVGHLSTALNPNLVLNNKRALDTYVEKMVGWYLGVLGEVV